MTRPRQARRGRTFGARCSLAASRPRHHTIADGQRLAGRVGSQALAEFGYLTDHFVTHGERAWQWQLATEDVQVGTADAGHPQPQRRGARRQG